MDLANVKKYKEYAWYFVQKKSTSSLLILNSTFELI